MGGLKTRVEALKAMTPKGGPFRVELMTYTDARTLTPAPAGPHLDAVTRIVLMPLTRLSTTTKGAAHGYA